MIVKDIETNNICKEKSLIISSFKPDGLKTIINNIPKKNFIIGVGYSEGDFQIGISGKRKKDENINDTMIREMTEELSLRPIFRPELYFKNCNNTFYIINLKDTILLKAPIDNINKKRDTTDRAVICIHGNEKIVKKYLSNVKIKPNNEDFITHIWADSAENIIKYL